MRWEILRFIKLITYYLLGMVSIFCVSIFPQYFSTRGTTSSGYFEQLISFGKDLFRPESWIYKFQSSQTGGAPMMEIMGPAFVYSMQILLGALFAGFSIALLLALGSVFLPKVVLSSIKEYWMFLSLFQTWFSLRYYKYYPLLFLNRWALIYFRLLALKKRLILLQLSR